MLLKVLRNNCFSVTLFLKPSVQHSIMIMPLNQNYSREKILFHCTDNRGVFRNQEFRATQAFNGLSSGNRKYALDWFCAVEVCLIAFCFLGISLHKNEDFLILKVLIDFSNECEKIFKKPRIYSNSLRSSLRTSSLF